MTVAATSGPLLPDQGTSYVNISTPTGTALFSQDVAIALNAGSTVCAAMKISSPPATGAGTGTWTVQANGFSGPISSTAVTTKPGTWTPFITCVDSVVAISTIDVRYAPAVGSAPVALDSVVVNVDLLSDGGFNAATSPWLAAAGSTVAIYSAGAAGQPYEGRQFGETKSTAAGGGLYQNATVPALPGATYCVSGLVMPLNGASGAGGAMTLSALGGAGGAANQSSTVSFASLPAALSWTPEQTCLTISGTAAYTTLQVQFSPTPGSSPLAVDAVNLNSSTGRLLYWLEPAGVTNVVTPVLGALPPGCGAPVSTTGVVVWAACAGPDGSTTINAAPINSPETTLWVASVDAAGDISPATPLRLTNIVSDPNSSLATAHRWLPDRLVAATAGTKLPDSAQLASATQQPLTLSTGATWTSSTVVPGTSSTVLHLNGAGTATAATGTVAIDTTKSFTVSAWVQPDKSLSTSGTYTIASEGSASTSTFALQLANDQWQFCLTSSPLVTTFVVTAPSGCVQSATTVNLGVQAWALVTGVWDSVNQQLRIYVGDGSPQVVGRAAPNGDISAPGPFTLGFCTGAAAATHWIGNIDDVWAIQATLDAGQLADLGQQPRKTDITSW